MNVELPWYLFFLFLIAIPIIIHLLNFQRPKKLLFTRLDFIEKIEQKSKNVRNIKKWLILFSRIGLVVSLVLAFAVPFLLEDKKEQKAEEVFFLLDANPRMGHESKKVAVLEHAKSFLHKYLKENPLLTYKLATQTEAVRYKSSAEYLNEKIEAVSLSRKSLSSPAVAIEQLEVGEEGKAPVYLISDFHHQVELSDLDTTQRITFVKMRKEIQRNVFVDSVYITNQDDVRYITVELKSSGEVTSEADIRLMIDGVLQGAERCQIQKDGKKKLKFVYESTSELEQKAKIIIKDNDADFDNAFYFVLPAKQVYQVGVIGRKQLLGYVGRMFQLEQDFDVSLWEHSTIDYQQLEKCKTLVFELSADMTYNNTMIQKIKSLGVSLVLIPNQSLSVSSFKKVLLDVGLPYSAKQESIKEGLELDPVKKNSFFNAVFKEFDERVNMPKVTPYVSLGNTAKNILALNTKGLLVGNDQGFVFGFDLIQNKDFFNHALSLPIFYELLNVLNKSQNGVSYTRSVEQYKVYVDPALNVQNVSVGGVSRAFTKVQDKLVIDNLDDVEAGFHTINVNDSAMNLLAVNLPTRESLVDFYGEDELMTLAKANDNWGFVSLGNQSDVENFIQSGGDESFPLWKYCVILALMFLLMEVVLIRIS